MFKFECIVQFGIGRVIRALTLYLHNRAIKSVEWLKLKRFPFLVFHESVHTLFAIGSKLGHLSFFVRLLLFQLLFLFCENENWRIIGECIILLLPEFQSHFTYFSFVPFAFHRLPVVFPSNPKSIQASPLWLVCSFLLEGVQCSQSEFLVNHSFSINSYCFFRTKQS